MFRMTGSLLSEHKDIASFAEKEESIWERRQIYTLDLFQHVELGILG